MDFNKRNHSNWDKSELMELMNSKELHELMDWEMNHNDHDSPDLFRVNSWEDKAFEILKEALKREMLNDNVDWKCDHSYVTACPTLCKNKWDEYAKYDETTALYHAIKKHAPLDVIKAIVDGFPDALQICEKQSPNDDPLLHLHVAINKGALMDMVALLFEAGPEHAILMRDKVGNTPLHCACIVKAEPAIIEYLHCHYPGATNIQNNDSYKPREYAFDSNRSHDVTMWLYEEWPEMEKIDMHTLEEDDECAMYRVLPSD